MLSESLFLPNIVRALTPTVRGTFKNATSTLDCGKKARFHSFISLHLHVHIEQRLIVHCRQSNSEISSQYINLMPSRHPAKQNSANKNKN
jgi:hypothetical protein